MNTPKKKTDPVAMTALFGGMGATVLVFFLLTNGQMNEATRAAESIKQPSRSTQVEKRRLLEEDLAKQRRMEEDRTSRERTDDMAIEAARERLEAAKLSAKVVYRVDGGERVSLTYANSGGDTEQETVNIAGSKPWLKTFTTKRGAFLYVSAQNQEDFDYTTTITIQVDGKEVKQSSSKGAFTIASCSYAIPNASE